MRQSTRNRRRSRDTRESVVVVGEGFELGAAFVDARIDGAMCCYYVGEPMRDVEIEAGFKDDLPRVWDPDRIYVLLDHLQPTFSQKSADENAIVRRKVEGLGIKCFHDSEPAIEQIFECGSLLEFAYERDLREGVLGEFVITRQWECGKGLGKAAAICRNSVPHR